MASLSQSWLHAQLPACQTRRPSVSICLSVCLYYSVSVSLCPSVCPYLFVPLMCLSVAVSLCLSPCLSVCVCWSLLSLSAALCAECSRHLWRQSLASRGQQGHRGPLLPAVCLLCGAPSASQGFRDKRPLSPPPPLRTDSWGAPLQLTNTCRCCCRSRASHMRCRPSQPVISRHKL